MHNRGQSELQTVAGVISLIITILILLYFASSFISLFRADQCREEIQQMRELTNKLQETQLALNDSEVTAAHWKAQYFNLTNTTITKKDFEELQLSVDKLVYGMNATRYELYDASQQITNVQNIQNTFVTLTIVFAITFTLTLTAISLTLIDFLFFKFEFTLKIMTWIHKKRN